MTEYEKYIYNTFLRVSRSSQSLPYKYREDFSDFQIKEPEKYILVSRIAKTLQSSCVNVDDFFKAPYDIYCKDSKYYLEFYNTQKAIKAYSLYKEKLLNEDPDAPRQLQFIADSLLFIEKFCKQHQISLSEYLNFVSEKTPDFILHLNNRSVSLYLLLSFNSFESKLMSFGKEWVEFILGEALIDRLGSFRVKLYNSTKARRLADRGIQIVEKKLNSDK